MSRDGLIPEKRDRILAASLATGATQEQAASAACCSPRTVRRRLEDPQFCRLISDTRERLFDQVLGRALEQATSAAEVLSEVMKDGGASASARVSAARSLLEAVLRYREAGELDRRLRILEERLQ